MEDETRGLLEEAIKDTICSLETIEKGTKEYSMAVEALKNLYMLKIEETRSDMDYDENYNKRIMEKEQHERDEELKKKQLSEQAKDRISKIGIGLVEIILPLIFYGRWSNKVLKFEETGSIASFAGKNLFNRFKPTKK